MFRTSAAVSAMSLTVVGVVAIAGCGGSGGGGAAAPAAPGASSAPPASAPVASAPAPGATATAPRATGAASAAGCSGGLTGTEPGVIQIVCDGTARIHVQAGSVARQFTGGQCEHAGDVWEATDGVITEAGVYQGKPVDVVSVNKDSNGGGTIQLMLGGKNLFVEGATLTLSDGGKQAHLHGTTTSLSDVAGLAVTVDVAC